MKPKIGLGAVQFGLNYGVTNNSGVTSNSEVRKILEFVHSKKFKCIDTAPAYGNSELVLGEYEHLLDKTPIITKTVNIKYTNDSLSACKEILSGFDNSLKSLKKKSIHTILVHDPKLLMGPNANDYFQILSELKFEGKVKNIGVSIYTQREAECIFDKFKLDTVQLPISIYDQRLIKNNVISELSKKNVEIHARSIFLQGILLESTERLKGSLVDLKEHHQKYCSHLALQGITPLESAISFIHGLKEIDVVLCGVNNISQLVEIYQAAINNKQIDDPEQYRIENENILNPALW